MGGYRMGGNLGYESMNPSLGGSGYHPSPLGGSYMFPPQAPMGMGEFNPGASMGYENPYAAGFNAMAYNMPPPQQFMGYSPPYMAPIPYTHNFGTFMGQSNSMPVMPTANQIGDLGNIEGSSHQQLQGFAKLSSKKKAEG
jgi:hypothetical protein